MNSRAIEAIRVITNVVYTTSLDQTLEQKPNRMLCLVRHIASLKRSQSNITLTYHFPGLFDALCRGESAKLPSGGNLGGLPIRGLLARAPRGDAKLLVGVILGELVPVPVLEVTAGAKLPTGGILFRIGEVTGSAIVAAITSSSSSSFSSGGLLARQASVALSKRANIFSLCSINIALIVSPELCWILPNLFFGFLDSSLDQKLWSGVTNTKEWE